MAHITSQLFVCNRWKILKYDEYRKLHFGQYSGDFNRMENFSSEFIQFQGFGVESGNGIVPKNVPSSDYVPGRNLIEDKQENK